MCLEMSFRARIYLVYIYVPEFCRETRSHVLEFAPDARVIAVGMPHIAREITVISRGYTVERDFTLDFDAEYEFTELRFMIFRKFFMKYLYENYKFYVCIVLLKTYLIPIVTCLSTALGCDPLH